MFEAGSCTLVSEAVLKQSALSPRRFAFATCLPGKTAPRARGRRRKESSPLPMRSLAANPMPKRAAISAITKKTAASR